ncbi:HYC_CC_PP family protein [Chitinophaga lutea]
MKKITVICIAVLYTLITSGFSVNVHYCMGRLASVDLHDSHDEGCGVCGMPVKGKCCKDEAHFLKLDNLHQAAKAFQGFAQVQVTTLPVVQPVWLQPEIPATVLQVWAPLHAPPLIPDTPIYLQHCVFLV